MLQAQRERIEGVATFADELGRALRREFADLWRRPRPRAGAQLAPEDQLVGRVDLLLERVARARRLLDDVRGMRTGDALQAFRDFDSAAMVTLGRGLQALAQSLRAGRPRSASGATAPLPAAAPRSTMPLPAADPKLSILNTAWDFAEDLLIYMAPRMEVLALALRLTGLPERRRDWDLVVEEFELLEDAGEVSPVVLQWLPLVVREIYDAEPAMRAAAVAVARWREASALHAEAGLLREALATAPEGAERLLARFDPTVYRRALYPLSHVHMTFLGMPALKELFPPPED